MKVWVHEEHDYESDTIFGVYATEAAANAAADLPFDTVEPYDVQGRPTVYLVWLDDHDEVTPTFLGVFGSLLVAQEAAEVARYDYRAHWASVYADWALSGAHDAQRHADNRDRALAQLVTLERNWVQNPDEHRLPNRYGDYVITQAEVQG